MKSIRKQSSLLVLKANHVIIREGKIERREIKVKSFYILGHSSKSRSRSSDREEVRRYTKRGSTDSR